MYVLLGGRTHVRIPAASVLMLGGADTRRKDSHSEGVVDSAHPG
jgi:hypothetical protein